MASATAMQLDSAHQLTDQTHPLSTALAITMSPDSPQFPDCPGEPIQFGG